MGILLDPSEIELALIKQAIDHPGSCQSAIYFPFLNTHSQTSLYLTIKRLIDCGYLRAEKMPDRVRLWATKKGVKDWAKVQI